jgi:hypothetical protein
MKNYAIIMFSVLFYACGGNNKETQTDFSNITFTMDTVVVDPGDEIINLRGGLWSSVMTADNSKLFIWDNQATTLDIIDINELKLTGKVKFEKEGPNGVGSYVSWMSLLDDEHILMANFNGMGLFDLEGNKLRSYKIEKEKLKGDSISDDDSFYRKSIITEDGNVIYGLIGNGMHENEFFAKLDFEKNFW